MAIMMRRMLMLGALSAGAISSGTRRTDAETEHYQDGFTVMVCDPRFRIWTDLMGAADANGLLIGATPFTLLAPVNDALERYSSFVHSISPADKWAMPHPARLTTFIKGHFCIGLHPISEFLGTRSELQTMAGTTVSLDGTQPGFVTVTWTNLLGRRLDARLIDRPLQVANGRIYPMGDPQLS